MKDFKRKRYTVMAKRRDTDEPWSDWTDCDNYQRAVQHAYCVEVVGYLADIVVREKQIEELWDILGKYEHEKADAVFDAGFRKQSEVVKDILLPIDQMMRYHASGDINDKTLYALFDELKQKYLEGEDG